MGSSLEVALANMIPGIVRYRPFGKLAVVNLDSSGKESASTGLFVQGNASKILPLLVERVKELV